MDSVGQIISGLIGVGIVLMIAPRVLAANKGKILRNIAIWIGIFLVLALVYQTYGPGKLEGQQAGNESPQSTEQPTSSRTTDEPTDQVGADKGDPDKEEPLDDQPTINEEQGFTPPREE